MLPWIWFLFSIAFFIIMLSLIMSPDSNLFSGALVGSSDLDLFKVSRERGSKKIFKRFMFTAGISLMIISLIIRSYI